MKKKLKMLICCLFLIPCIVVMSGCATSINSVEYAKLLKQTSDNYYSTIAKTDFTITHNKVIEEKSLEAVNHSYDGSQYSTDWCELKVTSTETETIIVDYVGDSLHNIQITTYEKEVENGSKIQEDGTGVEKYITTRESTLVKTLVTTADGFNIYVKSTVVEDGELNSLLSYKKVYTSTSGAMNALYLDIVNSFFEDLDEGVIAEAYFSYDLENMLLSSDIYKNGNEFGMTMEYAFTNVSDGEASLISTKTQYLYKDNKPSKVDAVVSIESGTEENRTLSSLNKTVSVEMNYTGRITAPSGSDWVSASGMPNLYITGFSVAI